MDIRIINETPPWDWPEDTGETLMRVLRDRRSSEADRLLAAELAGNPVVIKDPIADLLLSIVQNADEPEQLRATAAISLGPVLQQTEDDGFDDDGFTEPLISEMMFDRIRATLRRVHEDESAPKTLRRRVLEASVRAPQEWHKAAIRDAFARADDDEWQLTAIFCTRWVRGFDAKILKMLESPSAEVKREAILAAGNWEVKGAWPHVRSVLASEAPEKFLLLAAIEAAGTMGAEKEEEAGPLLAELSESEDEDIAEAASDALLMADLDIDGDEDEDSPF